MQTLARRMEEGSASLAVIQGGVSNEKLEPVLAKYDNLTDILGQDHQLILGVLQHVPQPTYRARTPVRQALIDRIAMQGVALLRMVDRDMINLATDIGNFEGNAIYSSLTKLRTSLTQTIAQYPRIVGS